MLPTVAQITVSAVLGLLLWEEPAELMGADVRGGSATARHEALPQALIELMRDIGIPRGLTAIGYGEPDVPALVAGTLLQPRLLTGAPRVVGAQDLDRVLREAMATW